MSIYNAPLRPLFPSFFWSKWCPLALHPDPYSWIYSIHLRFLFVLSWYRSHQINRDLLCRHLRHLQRCRWQHAGWVRLDSTVRAEISKKSQKIRWNFAHRSGSVLDFDCDIKRTGQSIFCLIFALKFSIFKFRNFSGWKSWNEKDFYLSTFFVRIFC